MSYRAENAQDNDRMGEIADEAQPDTNDRCRRQPRNRSRAYGMRQRQQWDVRGERRHRADKRGTAGRTGRAHRCEADAHQQRLQGGTNPSRHDERLLLGGPLRRGCRAGAGRRRHHAWMHLLVHSQRLHLRAGRRLQLLHTSQCGEDQGPHPRPARGDGTGSATSGGDVARRAHASVAEGRLRRLAATVRRHDPPLIP